jgi:hypothetical protein
MTLDKLMLIVEESYGGDGHILAYYGDPDGQHGDGLAAFVVQEFTENFLPDDDGEKAQLEEALHLMDNAVADLHRIIAALHAALRQSLS